MTALIHEGGIELVTPELAAAAEAIDWSDLDRAAETAEQLLDAIAELIPADAGFEAQIPAAAGYDCALAEGGQPLWSDGRTEIAICRMSPAGRTVAQPNHRHTRPLTARVFDGRIRLALFGMAGPQLAEGTSAEDSVAPRFLREDGQGRTITLHPDQQHLLEVEQAVTLLVVRGPVVAPHPAEPR
ncbi:MAG: hypothetical protein ACJ74U_07040 [Jatrophihabitantaceae bacterium]